MRPEHRVAEELEALVVGQAAVLVGVRAVREGTQEQRLVDVLADHLKEVGEQRHRRAAADRQNTRRRRSRGCSRRSGLVLGALGAGVVAALVGAAGRAREVRLRRAPHWGHVVSVVGVAFQFARRERVLERDIFRFGTATSVPLLLRVASQQSAEGHHRGSITS